MPCLPPLQIATAPESGRSIWQCEANLWGRQKSNRLLRDLACRQRPPMPHVMNRDFGTSPLKGHFPDGLTRLSLIASRGNDERGCVRDCWCRSTYDPNSRVKPGKSRQIAANETADPRTSVRARSTDVWHDSGEGGARELLISTEQDNTAVLDADGAGCGRRRTNLAAPCFSSSCWAWLLVYKGSPAAIGAAPES
jgi:hypothetical protein